MCNVSKKIGAVFCTFGIILMFIAGLMFNTSAAEDKNSKLTLICEHDNVRLAGMNWSVYTIGEKRGNSYSLTSDFADYPIDLSEIMEKTEAMTEAASTLSNFAVLDDIPPIASGETNADGVAEFYNLEPGLYLAVGNKLKIDSVSYFPTPFIIEVNGTDVTAYPKFMAKYTLPGSTSRFSLRKIWVNAALVSQIPPSLTIEIYQDGELFDTVDITAENNWTYSWDGDASSEWRVKEVNVPPGCFVMYRNNELQFVVMNSYDNELLAKITTATTVTTTNTTTVSVSDDYTTSTTKSPLIDIGSSIVTTVTSENSVDVSTTTGHSLIDIGSGTMTTLTSVVLSYVRPGESSVSSENGTYPTDTNGSTITTVATTKKDDSGSKSTKSSKSTITTTPEKLPQTGQLWWPVPVMLFGGLVFVAIGLRLLLDSRKED